MMKLLRPTFARTVSAMFSMYCIFDICAFSDDYIQEAKILLEDNAIDPEQWASLYSCRYHCNCSYNKRKYCYCDFDCIVYRNCCEDMAAECPEETEEGIRRFGHMLDLQVDCLQMSNTLAITSCPTQTKFTKKLINEDSFFDILINVPITDGETGLVYANNDIFHCNSNNTGINWTITVLTDDLSPSEFLTNIANLSLHLQSPLYYVSEDMRNPYGCAPRSLSLCNHSVVLQRLCRSFIPHLLLNNLIYNHKMCKACRLNLSTYSLDDSVKPREYGRAKIVPEEGVLQINEMVWKEAKCDMSRNSTISEFKCQFVKCDSRYYLNKDGSCRKFTLLFIAIQNDLWLPNQDDYDDVLNYTIYYLQSFLRIFPFGTVRPVYSLYSTELQENVSIFTFLIDFNSSALTEYIYFTYKYELTILASKVRSWIEDKINLISLSTTEFELIHGVIERQWLEIQTNQTNSDLMNLYWCSNPEFTFSLFTSAQNRSPVCLSRLVHLQILDGVCVQLDDEAELRCYDELKQDKDLLTSKQTSSNVNKTYLNLMPVFVNGVVFILNCLITSKYN